MTMMIDSDKIEVPAEVCTHISAILTLMTAGKVAIGGCGECGSPWIKCHQCQIEFCSTGGDYGFVPEREPEPRRRFQANGDPMPGYTEDGDPIPDQTSDFDSEHYVDA